MTPEEIKNATEKLKRLTDYVKVTEAIEKFADSLEQNGYLEMKTSYQEELNLSSSEIYRFFGDEVIYMLRNKIADRKTYVLNVGADDLLKAPKATEPHSNVVAEAEEG